jgi:hypothetical protein
MDDKITTTYAIMPMDLRFRRLGSMDGAPSLSLLLWNLIFHQWSGLTVILPRAQKNKGM